MSELSDKALDTEYTKLLWSDYAQTVEELEAKIADLEAEILELKLYRDGYDASEILPEEREKVFAKTKHGIFVAQHKFDNWYNMFGEIVIDEVECWWKIPGTWK